MASRMIINQNYKNETGGYLFFAFRVRTGAAGSAAPPLSPSSSLHLPPIFSLQLIFLPDDHAFYYSSSLQAPVHHGNEWEDLSFTFLWIFYLPRIIASPWEKKISLLPTALDRCPSTR